MQQFLTFSDFTALRVWKALYHLESQGLFQIHNPISTGVCGSSPWVGLHTYHGARYTRRSCRPHVTLHRNDKHFNGIPPATLLFQSPPLGGPCLSTRAHGTTSSSALRLMLDLPPSSWQICSDFLCQDQRGLIFSLVPGQGLDLAGVLPAIFCSRAAPGPLFGEHLLAPGATSDTARAVITPYGASLAPSPWFSMWSALTVYQISHTDAVITPIRLHQVMMYKRLVLCRGHAARDGCGCIRSPRCELCLGLRGTYLSTVQ